MIKILHSLFVPVPMLWQFFKFNTCNPSLQIRLSILATSECLQAARRGPATPCDGDGDDFFRENGELTWCQRRSLSCKTFDIV